MQVLVKLPFQIKGPQTEEVLAVSSQVQINSRLLYAVCLILVANKVQIL